MTRVYGLEFRVEGLGFTLLSWFKFQGLPCQVALARHDKGLGLRVYGLRFTVYGLPYQVALVRHDKGLGFRV